MINANTLIGMKGLKWGGLNCDGFWLSNGNRERRKKKTQKNETWSRYQLVVSCTQKGRETNMKETWILEYEELRLCKIYPKWDSKGRVNGRRVGKNSKLSTEKVMKVIVVATLRPFINVIWQEDKVCLCRSTSCRRKHTACLCKFVGNLNWNSIILSTSNTKDVCSLRKENKSY